MTSSQGSTSPGDVLQVRVFTSDLNAKREGVTAEVPTRWRADFGLGSECQIQRLADTHVIVRIYAPSERAAGQFKLSCKAAAPPVIPMERQHEANSGRWYLEAIFDVGRRRGFTITIEVIGGNTE